MTERPVIREEARPRARPATEAVWVGDRALLHDRRFGHVLGLSHSAGVIWDRCDGRTSVLEMGDELSQALDRPAADVVPEVAAGVADLHARGLLILDADDVRSAGGDDTFDVVFDGQAVTVRIGLAEGDRILRRLFRHMTDPGAVRERIGRVTLEASGEGLKVTPLEERYPPTGSMPDALGLAKRAVVDRFVGARPDLVWLHAGAAARGDEAVIFVGGFGSGKTTFVTALGERGWQYLSDDVVAIDPETDQVHAFPLAPQPRTPPGEQVDPERVREFPRRIADLEPGAVRRAPARLARVVLPEYAADGPNELAAVDPVIAAMELTANRLDRDPDGTSFRHLCRLAGGVPAHKLSYCDSPSAIDALVGMVSQTSDAGRPATSHAVSSRSSQDAAIPAASHQEAS